MDKKFLHKVIDQIVYETKLDHEKKRIDLSLSSHFSLSSFISFKFFIMTTRYHHFNSSLFPRFYTHCREIYGLNKKEIEYVWKEYTNIILDKIKNG